MAQEESDNSDSSWNDEARAELKECQQRIGMQESAILNRLVRRELEWFRPVCAMNAAFSCSSRVRDDLNFCCTAMRVSLNRSCMQWYSIIHIHYQTLTIIIIGVSISVESIRTISMIIIVNRDKDSSSSS